MKDMGIGARIGILFILTLAAGIANTALVFMFVFWIPLVSIAISALILIPLAVSTAKSISNPVEQMAKAAEQLSQGIFSVDLQAAGEHSLGVLGNNLISLAGNLKNFSEETETFVKKHEAGEWEASVSGKSYSGSFKEMLDSINKMTASYARGTMEILECLDNFSKGDFRASLRPYTGKKAQINEHMDLLKNNLINVNNDIRSLTAAIGEAAPPRNPVDANKYGGEWKRIITDINGLFESAVRPAAEIAESVEKLSRGDFSPASRGNYKGEFNKLKDAVNGAAATISAYLNELSGILTSMANNNFNQSLTRDYANAYPGIKDGIEKIKSKLKSKEAEPILTRAAVTPAARPAERTAAVRKNVTSGMPTLSQARAIVPPSASRVYDSKDFGKYT